MRSQLTADYSSWDFLVFQPLEPALIEEIEQERGLPEQIISDGFFWPTSTSTFSLPSTAGPTPPYTPQPPLDIVSSSPTAETPTPLSTSTILLPRPTGTPQPTRTSVPATTSTFFATATKTFIYYPASSSPTLMPDATSTSTVIAPTASLTLTSTHTVTSTTAPTHTFTPTATLTSTSTLSPTNTPTISPTYTFTPTATFASTFTPTRTATPTGDFTATPDPTEPDFGGPDGNTTVLGNGTSLEFSLSGFLLDGDPAWDVVYYEKKEAGDADKIHLGAFLIEVYDETTATWYTVYHWGDGIVDTNASYNHHNDEPDGFPVHKSDLYGAAPLNTGIAVDIDTRAIGQGGAVGDSITMIRITSLSNVYCELDALQMLR